MDKIIACVCHGWLHTFGKPFFLLKKYMEGYKQKWHNLRRCFFFSSKSVLPKIWGHPTHSIGSTHTTRCAYGKNAYVRKPNRQTQVFCHLHPYVIWANFVCSLLCITYVIRTHYRYWWTGSVECIDWQARWRNWIPFMQEKFL